MTAPARDWRADAACLDTDPELFFAPGRGALDRAQEAQAKAVCRGCPVRAPCLAAAEGEAFGVFGGMTTDERRQHRQGQQRPPRSPMKPRGAIRYHLDQGRSDTEILARLDVDPALITALREAS